MDHYAREITKIAREAGKLTVRAMRETGVGSGEMDMLHIVRHRPGVSQKELAEALNMDKSAVARQAASLERKGYLRREHNPADSRGWMLYATERAEGLKRSRTAVENTFYGWLTEGLDEAEREVFQKALHTLYLRSKTESRRGFPEVSARLEAEERE